jgi:preprotein translocase subunit SecF
MGDLSKPPKVREPRPSTTKRRLRDNLRDMVKHLALIAVGSLVAGIIAGLLSGSRLFGLFSAVVIFGIAAGVYLFGTDP